MKASVKKDLLMRLSKLESQLGTRRRWGSVVRSHWIDLERRENLAEGERIVVDCYRCLMPSTGFFWGRERITRDPDDRGRICRAGQCLKDVLEEIGEVCERQPDGRCRACARGQYPEWVEQDPTLQAALDRSGDPGSARDNLP